MSDLIPSVLFVLPAKGGGGGANSVVQEAMGLARLGTQAAIAVQPRHQRSFLTNYPELNQRSVQVVTYEDPQSLAKRFSQYNIICATTNESVQDVASAKTAAEAEKLKGFRVVYYVQDYEPLFYPPNSREWKVAYRSYTLMKDAVLFAKTKWLCDIVYLNHGVRVAKVSPSIDHDIYFANGHQAAEPLSVAAMLRPQTPRRAPKRTVRIMERMADRYGDRVELQVFGATAETLAEHGIHLSPRIHNLGVLKRTEVPNVLRQTDLFLDLSDFQAFGRTGLEAMACGVIPVLPVFGGGGEYAIHGNNAYVVDTRSDDSILDAIDHFMALESNTRNVMRMNAIRTAADYSIHKAAVSEIAVFREALDL